MHNTQELWRIIPEYPKYLASNTGKIMSLPTVGKSTNNYVIQTNQKAGRVLKPRIIPAGGHLQVNLGHYKKEKYIHQLVAMAWLKRKKQCNIVMHLDDNPKNNHVDNLKWGTQLENSRWKYKHEKFGKLKNKSKTIYSQSVLLQQTENLGIVKSLLILGKKYNRTKSTMWLYYCKGKKLYS